MRLRRWRTWTRDRNRQLVAGRHAGIGSSASQTCGCVGCVIRKTQRVICSGSGPMLKDSKYRLRREMGPRHGNELGRHAWAAKLALSITSSRLSLSQVIHESRDTPAKQSLHALRTQVPLAPRRTTQCIRLLQTMTSLYGDRQASGLQLHMTSRLLSQVHGAKWISS